MKCTMLSTHRPREAEGEGDRVDEGGIAAGLDLERVVSEHRSRGLSERTRRVRVKISLVVHQAHAEFGRTLIHTDTARCLAAAATSVPVVQTVAVLEAAQPEFEHSAGARLQ